MSTENIPNRASDAGPEPTPDPDWRDLLFYASDQIHDGIRISRDDIEVELADRRRAIDIAIQYLQDAKAALPHQTKGRM